MRDDDSVARLRGGMKWWVIPVSLIILALLGTLGWQWWQKKQSAQAAQLTAQYQNLLKQSAQSTDAKTAATTVKNAQAIVQSAPKSIQAFQSQLLMAKLAFDQKDYPRANQLLTEAVKSPIKDEGLISIAKLHLAYTQIAQNQLDNALKTLQTIQHAAFVPSVAEAKGDIYIAQKKPDAAKAAYKQAWDALVQRQQPRELLQLKLADLGILVEAPTIESPIKSAEPLAAELPSAAATQEPSANTAPAVSANS